MPTASPVIDAETGNVYMQGSQGILAAFSADGKPLWRHSLMEEYGRLTFPTAAPPRPPLTGTWSSRAASPPTGEPKGRRAIVFTRSTRKPETWFGCRAPGAQPKDNSFSHPQFGWYHGQRVFFAALGDGSVVCVNARTGEPIWRVSLFRAGINATVLVHKGNKVIAIYGTPYELGQMVALKIPDVEPASAAAGPVVLERKDVELWAQNISSSTSSPILVDDTIYMVAEKGDLFAVDANTGTIKWKLKLGIEQRNSCPLFADGKLYVPILDDPDAKATGETDAGTTGAFYIIKPGETEGQILCHTVLDGRCFGTPVAYNGKIYLQTTRHLYCWGKPGNNPGCPSPVAEEPWPAPGKATQLQIIPSEVLLHPGEKAGFRVRSLDANGFTVDESIAPDELKWVHFIPATAKVKASLRGDFNSSGELVAAPDPVLSAGAFEATYQGPKGLHPRPGDAELPLKQDFESFALNQTDRTATISPIRRCLGLGRGSSSTCGTRMAARSWPRPPATVSSSAPRSSSARPR